MTQIEQNTAEFEKVIVDKINVQDYLINVIEKGRML
jgi:hypothetical protein